ncbi:MAG TPA: hypothetical protein VM425_16480 [Myxococcota bacterium]|nr:hypothetical protein [Myxococcota bacterium]
MAACLVLTIGGPARARFEMGTMHVGAGLGLRGGDEGVTFSFNGSFGFFVLHGLELSISPLLQTGGGEPTIVLLEGGLRFIPLPDLELTPYLKVSGGRLFVIDEFDAWMVSAGGGLLYLFGPWYGIDISGGYRWFFWPADDSTDSTSGTYYVQLGLLLLF